MECEDRGRAGGGCGMVRLGREGNEPETVQVVTKKTQGKERVKGTHWERGGKIMGGRKERMKKV